nr:FtsK/SpoIIIE domain-containing protein [Clostridium perfringens]
MITLSDNSTKFLEDFINEILVLIGDILKELFKVIVILFKSAGIGIKKSWKNKKLFIGLVPACLIPIVARINVDFFFVDRKFYFKIIYFLLWFSPLYYFALVSLFKDSTEKERENIRVELEKLNFVGADSKLPFLKAFIKDEGTKINEMIFESMIPIEVWKSNIAQLQNALNISIISIEQGDSKRIVIVKCMPGDAKIPEEIMWNDNYIQEQEGVVTIGETFSGEIKIDLNKSPHVLAAGETGSGKSVVLRCILWQLLNQGAIAYMLDFKGGIEFGLEYEKVGKVVTEVDDALSLFASLVEENKIRMQLLRESRSKNISEYNNKFKDKTLKRIVVFVDELAELLDKTGVDNETKEKLLQIEGYMSTLSRLSRATGINLILGVQRPDAKVVPGQIKNNVPVRICGKFADAKASEIVLSNTKAKDLPAVKGRFLFKLGAETIQFQAYFFNDDKHFKPNKILELRESEGNINSDADIIVDETLEESNINDNPNTDKEINQNINKVKDNEIVKEFEVEEQEDETITENSQIDTEDNLDELKF